MENRVAVATQVTPIYKGNSFSINLHVLDKYTYFVAISVGAKILKAIPIDAQDNTVAAEIDADCLTALGAEAPVALEQLSKWLREQVGAKGLFVVPADCKLPEYGSPSEVKGCERLRQGKVSDLVTATETILQKQSFLRLQLDLVCELALDEKALLKGSDELGRILEVNALLKQSESTLEETLPERMARIKHKFVNSVFVMHKTQKKPFGMIRALVMGNKFVYLSDVIMNPNLVSLTYFSGNDAEKTKQRETFLLAYVIHKACKCRNMNKQEHALIMAKQGAEDIYELLGFKLPTATDNWQIRVNFGLSDKPILVAMRAKIKKLSHPKGLAVVGKSEFSITGLLKTLGVFAGGLQLLSYLTDNSQSVAASASHVVASRSSAGSAIKSKL